MIKNKITKKKKGFTLIELIIVLSVLAIIALIAVPNFAKIKQNALKSADETSCAQITAITQMAIAEGIITVDQTTKFNLSVGDTDNINIAEEESQKIIYGKGYDIEDLKDRYISIKNPQSEKFNAYEVSIDDKGKTNIILIE